MRRLRTVLGDAPQNRSTVLSRAPTLHRRPPLGCYMGTSTISLRVIFCEVNHKHLDFAVHFFLFQSPECLSKAFKPWPPPTPPLAHLPKLPILLINPLRMIAEAESVAGPEPESRVVRRRPSTRTFRAATT